ncbi:TnsD family Tn7-like transposition protein [Chromobacterium violaceum]|uniref:TnsD family Tn7-like transposition protein n=1 Tax=Chromobacterium violaceum TaxID=536 RepID=UPI001C8B6FD7|nr:TnsD family Tn7-like transposition protein [Chromobacterium violaceum]MBX9267538.1 TnsD family transposase [Chromobacterium violaceum]
MLSYFPQIYRDELLYSVLARYHRHTGSTSPTQTLEDLFGNRHVHASLDLPGHLARLVRRIPPERGLSSQRMVYELTLYPYFLAFSDEIRRHDALLAMTKNGAAGLHMRLGLAATLVPAISQLRYCPACVNEMDATLGELYWRRSHQLPGVLVCIDHGEPLRLSQVRLGRESPHAFIAALRDNCQHGETPSIERSSSTWHRIEDLAQRSTSLLNQMPPPRAPEEWRSDYHDALVDRGFLRGNAKMALARLNEQFLQFHRLEWLRHLLGNKVHAGFDLWSAVFSRKRGGSPHPLYHLLLQQFLDCCPQIEGPFGRGPWPCLNPLEPHQGQLLIHSVSTHRNRKWTIGVFRCDCGYQYCRHVNEDGLVSDRHRPLAYGRIFEIGLREAIRSGESLRSTARLLHVDANTVRRQCVQLGLSPRWLLLGSPKECRNQHARISAPTKRARQRTNHPDSVSDQLDVVWREKVLAAAAVIRAIDPPQRVSKTRLERQIDRPGCLQKKFAYLPLTATAIQEVLESVETFRLRRVKWAVAQLQAQGITPMPWRVQRKAGLRHLSPQEIELNFPDLGAFARRS